MRRKATVRHFSELSVEELYSILKARVEVFVVEQTCPYQELDGKDRNAYHLWMEDEEGISAYARVLGPGVSFDDVAIGRVITLRRGKGLGLEIMKEAIQVAREKFGAKAISIEAQLYARGFYEKLGFRKCSDPFDEDGIPHIVMRLEIEQ